MNTEIQGLEADVSESEIARKVGDRIAEEWKRRLLVLMSAVVANGVAPGGTWRVRVRAELFGALCLRFASTGGILFDGTVSTISGRVLVWNTAFGQIEIIQDNTAADGGELTVAIPRKL